MGAKTNILNKKFGRLKAIEEESVRTHKGSVLFKFLCDCGNISVHEASRVKRGEIISCGCSRRVDDEQKALTRVLFSDYKAGAKNRSLTFNLTIEEFTTLINKNCFYCGVEPREQFRKFKGRANGVDRIDSSIGYNLLNVRPCCKICNLAKKDLSDSEFLEWIDRLVKHNEGL